MEILKKIFGWSGKTLSETIKDEKLAVEVKKLEEKLASTLEENQALSNEVAALKEVNTAADESDKKPVRLSDKEREFTAKWETPDPKGGDKPVKNSAKFRLENVAKIRISGKGYSQEEFMADKEAQSTAAAMDHTLIKKLD